MRMEGQKWTSFCPDQGCLCAEGGERHTGNKTLEVLLMTIWLLISARLNPMQSMMDVVLSSTQSLMMFRIITDCYNILHFIMYKSLCFF